MSGWSASMDRTIRALEVARGEVDHILTAAMADSGEALRVAEIEATLTANAIDTGVYIGSWDIEVQPLRVTVSNDAAQNDVEYAEYVHIQPNYGGPPGLGLRVWDDQVARIEADVTEGVSARVLELFR